jgi:uncharacterized protein
MSRQLADSTVDFVVDNAKQKGTGAYFLFHGGGEPTQAWDVLTRAVNRAREVALQQQVKVLFAIATNGILSQARCDWLATNVDRIHVSVDGDPEIQDAQRPTASGGRSSDIVGRTCERLRSRGVKFDVRATITQYSAERMDRVTQFLLSLGPNSIHYEPLTSCGRALEERALSPSPQLFVDAFTRSVAIAERSNAELYTSGTRLGRCSTKSCSAAGSTFCVTPDGWITACHRISNVLDPAAAAFFYGRFDFKTRHFELDGTKLELLSRLSVNNASACQDCVAKWHCSGGCYHENYKVRGELLLSECIAHCEIKRSLNAYFLGREPANVNGSTEGRQ